jgi:hypothetical protein
LFTGAESLLASLVAALILLPIIGVSDTNGVSTIGFFGMSIGYPFIETLLFQSLPIRIAQVFTRSVKPLILCGWLPFAIIHFASSLQSGICAGLVGGYFVGFSYAVWARRSHGKAILITTLMHGLGNAVIWIIMHVF